VTAPRVVANVTIGDNLSSIDSGLGAVWASDTAKGEILRLDPRSRRVLARIPVGGEARVTVGAGAVWAFNERGRVVRIDPATNRVTHRVALRLPSGDLLTSREVQILDGSPWAIGLEGALRLDPRDGHVEHFTRLPDTHGELRFAFGSGDSLWALDRQQTLNRYSLATGRRTGALPVRLPEVIAAMPTAAGPVYITHEGDVARADAGDGRIAWRRKLGTSVSGLPFLRGSTLWLHASDAAGRDRLVELDLETGETLSRATLPEFGATGLSFVGRQQWITTPNGHLMVLER